MNKFLLPLCFVFAATPVLAQAPTPLDGEWRGRSDGGSCNAPLEYVIFIELGLVDGSATDATAHGPCPTPRKARRRHRRPACGKSTAWRSPAPSR